MSRDPPPTEPAPDRPTSPPTLTIGAQGISTRAHPAASQLSPSHNTDSSSPRRVPRPIPQMSSHSSAHLAPSCDGGDAEFGKSGNAGPYGTSRATSRSSSSGMGYYHSGKEQGGHSAGYIDEKQSRRSRAISAPSPVSKPSHPFDFNEVQRGRARDKSSESRLHHAEVIHGITANTQIPIQSMKEGAGPALTW